MGVIDNRQDSNSDDMKRIPNIRTIVFFFEKPLKKSFPFSKKHITANKRAIVPIDLKTDILSGSNILFVETLKSRGVVIIEKKKRLRIVDMEKTESFVFII